MIYDSLTNLSRYACLPRFPEVSAFLERTDVQSLAEGEFPISGDELFVKVLRYTPKQAAENFFETHRRYTDVQIVFRGVEQMQVTHPSSLLPHTSYDEETDFQFFTATDDISSMVVRENEFIVFSPGEAHKPGCRWGALDEPVLKLVFKIRT